MHEHITTTMTSQVIAVERRAVRMDPHRRTREDSVTTTNAPHTTGAPTTATTGDSAVLVGALRINAVTSGSTGAVLAVGSPWLAAPIGAPVWLLAAIGVGLVVFAVDIGLALARPARLRVTARWIVAADVAWVLGAVPIIVAGLLTPLGSLLLALVTVAVAGFATAQVVGLRRLA